MLLFCRGSVAGLGASEFSQSMEVWVGVGRRNEGMRCERSKRRRAVAQLRSGFRWLLWR